MCVDYVVGDDELCEVYFVVVCCIGCYEIGEFYCGIVVGGCVGCGGEYVCLVVDIEC